MRMAERVNGRAAMIGCSAIALSTFAIKTNLIEAALNQNLQSIWWTLGVYAHTS